MLPSLISNLANELRKLFVVPDEPGRPLVWSAGVMTWEAESLTTSRLIYGTTCRLLLGRTHARLLSVNKTNIATTITAPKYPEKIAVALAKRK